MFSFISVISLRFYVFHYLSSIQWGLTVNDLGVGETFTLIKHVKSETNLIQELFYKWGRVNTEGWGSIVDTRPLSLLSSG